MNTCISLKHVKPHRLNVQKSRIDEKEINSFMFHYPPPRPQPTPPQKNPYKFDLNFYKDNTY